MRTRRFLYLVLVGLSAACGLVVEIVAGRMIAPYLGMSLYTWTAIIAVVLAGFSVGHWIGGQIAQRAGTSARSGVAWSLALAGASTLASIFLIRLVTGPVIDLGLAPVVTILLITSILFFLPSLFVGIASPVLTKLALDEEPQNAGVILGGFYAAGAAGSILGTLAAGFLLISWLGTTSTLLLVSGIYCVMAAILFFASPKGLPVRLAVLPVLALGAVGVAGLIGHRTGLFASACQVESDYYCIRVDDISESVGTPARVLVLDHLAHGINLRDFPRGFVSPYVELQDTLAQLHVGQNSPFRAFFIGGGAYTLPRAWLAAKQDAAITVVEVDPDVTEIARRHLWLEADARLTVKHLDARRALLDEPLARYDVVVGDAFHDITVPQHLVTEEFFAEVGARLRNGGIYLMNVVDHRERPRMALSVAASLTRHFPVVELWRSNETGERSTFVVAGLAAATPVAQLPSRFSEGVMFERLSSEQVVRLSAELQPIVLSDDFAPVERLIGVD